MEDERATVGFLTKERLLGLHRHKHFKWGMMLVVIFMISDLAFLNYKILSLSSVKSSEITAKTIIVPGQNSAVVPSSDSNNPCNENCVIEIKKEVAAAASQNKSQSSTVGLPANSQVKEYFVPFGAGSLASTDWQNVSGLQASIDGNSYGMIKQVTFEATVHVPTGNENVNVQLYSLTAKHQVWYSSVVFSGGTTPMLLISQPITLDPRNNLYQVQMQTQLSDPAYIDQARIHIITY